MNVNFIKMIQTINRDGRTLRCTIYDVDKIIKDRTRNNEELKNPIIVKEICIDVETNEMFYNGCQVW